MAALVPFTAHINIVPKRGRPTKSPATGPVVVRRGGRFDHVRSLQRIAVQIYEALEAAGGGDETDPVILPEPGGGQNRSRTTLDSRYANISYGGAVTPQFGNKPALVMIEGFFNATAAEESDQPAADTLYFHGNEQMSGPRGEQPWLGTAGLPNTTVASEVSTLKAAIDAAITTVNDDSGITLTVFRLEYKNITWGDKGHHFP